MGEKTPSNPEIVAQLSQAEKVLADQLKICKKIQSSLAKARAKCAQPGLHSKVLRDVCEMLRGGVQDSPNARLAAASQQIASLLESAGSKFQKTFRDRILLEAKKAGVACKRMADQWTLGPFALNVDLAKEVAELEYAKQVVAKSLPIDAAVLVQTAQEAGKELLAESKNLDQQADELAEAIRVSNARQAKRSSGAGLRAELPAVFREMTFIRQGKLGALAQAKFREYPLSRFVVETSRIARTEFKGKASRRFRLEPAVIENAGDAKKSIFFPKDLACGFGEGTYYQAIILIEK